MTETLKLPIVLVMRRSCIMSALLLRGVLGSWVSINNAGVPTNAAEDQTLLYAPTHNQK